MLGTSAALGRTLTPQDDTESAASIAVISHGLWQRRFGGDAVVIGRHLRTPDRLYTIVGVMPPRFRFPVGWMGTTDVDVWLPLTLSSAERIDRRSTTLSVVARLAPGVTRESAQDVMDGITGRLEREHPDTNKEWGANVMALNDRGVADFRPLFTLLLTAVGVVLIIATVNVVNLLLARGLERRGELTIHAALGAGRGRLLRALLTEGLLLTVIGGTAGAVLAWWGISALRTIAPVTHLPELRDMRLSVWVLSVTAATTILSGLVAAGLPAFTTSQIQLRDALDDRSRVGASRRGRRGRTVLVVAELTLTLLLFAAALTVARGHWHYMSIDPGFDPDGGIALRVSLQGKRYPTPETWTVYFERLREDLARSPGVEAVGLAANVPMGNGGEVSRYRIVGKESLATGTGPMGMQLNRISPEFFAAAGIRLRHGRGLQATDTAGSPPVAVVNEAFVRRAFGAEAPIGRQLVLQGDMNRSATGADSSPPIEIVGVVQDVKDYGLHLMTPPAVYVPIRQNPARALSLLVRAPAATRPSAEELRDRLHTLDPEQPAISVESLRTTFDRSHALLVFQTTLLIAAAAIAVLLALVGLFGVVSYAARQQSREWALRLALGARPSMVFAAVIGRALRLGLAGLAVGLALAPWALTLLTRSIKASLNVDLPATSPVFWAQLVMVLLSVAVAGGLAPAHRAMRSDPLATLRND